MRKKRPPDVFLHPGTGRSRSPYLVPPHYPLSTIHYPLSTIRSPLFTLHYPLSTPHTPHPTPHTPHPTPHFPLPTLAPGYFQKLPEYQTVIHHKVRLARGNGKDSVARGDEESAEQGRDRGREV